MNEILKVTNISKQFKEVKAVDALSFSVAEGEVYGFLGQNGAGKSTTIRILLTLISADEGQVQIFGKDIRTHRREILKQVGAIIEKPDLYQYLTGFQNIKLISKLYGIKASHQQLISQLEKLGIADRAETKVKTYSQGMKQRLGIACSLIHNPRLVILDEPTNGLDPQGIADVRNLILQLSRNEGKTVFVSSHLLSEIELIADSMLIIDRGKKIVEGKVNDLLNPAATILEVSTTDDQGSKNIISASAWGTMLLPGEGIVLKMNRKEIPGFAEFLIGKQVGLLALQPKHSLEDYFLSLTKSNQHVAAYTH